MKDADDANYSFCSIATDNVGWREPKDLTPEATDIQAVKAGTNGGSWTIYSVDGKVVARGMGALPAVLREGVYIVRSGNSSKKLLVK